MIRPIDFLDTLNVVASLPKRLRENKQRQIDIIQDEMLADWPAMAGLLGRVKKSLGNRAAYEAWLEVLYAGEIVPWEKAEGEDFNRFILPLTTNPLCNVYCGASARCVPIGELNMIDHLLPCSAVNFGKSIRVHLVMDVLKPQILENSDS